MNEADLFDRIEAERQALLGWCWTEKARKLATTILRFKPATCVEIGVFGGASFIPQAMAMKYLGQGKVYGIDAWDRGAALEGMKEEVNVSWWGDRVDLDAIYRDFLGHLTRLDLLEFCEVLRARAEDVADSFGDGTVGLLHIDGNHSEGPC